MRQFWAVTDTILAVHVDIIKLILQSASSQVALKIARGGIDSYGENTCLKSAFKKTAMVRCCLVRFEAVMRTKKVEVRKMGALLWG